MNPLLFFSVASLLAVSVSLVVLEPPNTQLPNIARTGEPYIWSISGNTFGHSDGTINYTVSRLPKWLSFDPALGRFSGTPSANDGDAEDITITAHDSTSSVSTTFCIPVSSETQPSLHSPISEQFYAANPSLSSVFVLAPGSALATNNPALRIPPQWSFSIGFKGDTFVSRGDIYYQVRQADGTALPDWMHFNPETITLNGVTPHEDEVISPKTIPLALSVSDRIGYSSSWSLFDVIITKDELSMTSKLPTMNVTASTSFKISLSSANDFSGCLVDGHPIQPSDIKQLVVNTSGYDWLAYDTDSRVLSGDTSGLNIPPENKPLLPVTLTSTSNQSIQSNLSLAFVPSCFSSPNLPPLQVVEGGGVHFKLLEYFSNATQNDDVNLTATPDPIEDNWLSFDSKTTQLTGSVPEHFASKHVTVTFTAYSGLTHSTSHTTLSIIGSASDYGKKGYGSHGSFAPLSHKKLLLGLKITFGIIGGIGVFGGLLAIFRRVARVEDTALSGEEGRAAWTEKDRKWYGTGDGYGWTTHSPTNHIFEKSRQGLDLQNPPLEYGNLGLGLQRFRERSQSSSAADTSSPGVMSKREFLSRIRETVRTVSNRYSPNRQVSPTRPTIGKPILRTSAPASPDRPPPNSSSDGQSNLGSMVMTGSPSASTADKSIPRRRPDFGPPRVLAQVHFEDDRLTREPSSGSTSSLASNSSTRTHAVEAVVQTASRVNSIRSGMSIVSNSKTPPLPNIRPRLVPFTSAIRVPVPSGADSPGHGPQSPGTSHRIASQTVPVWKHGEDNIKSSTSGDELTMGLHYVKTLGADQQTMYSNASSPSVVTNVRSSFSSLESSHQGHNREDVTRMLARVGDAFKFRVPLPQPVAARHLELKLLSDGPVPKFLVADLTGTRPKGTVEVSGVPSVSDLGRLDVGIYGRLDGTVVAKFILEIVKQS